MAKAGLEERKPLWTPHGRPPRSHAQGQGKCSGPSSSEAGPGGSECPKQKASAGHTSEDRNPGAAQAGGAQTATPRLPSSTGRPAGRAQQGGPGWAPAGRKVLLRRSEAARGTGSWPPGQSRVRTRQACTSLDTRLGLPGPQFLSTGRSRAAGKGQETQLCREIRSSRCSDQGPNSEATRSRAAGHEGRRAAGAHLVTESRCSPGAHPRPGHPQELWRGHQRTCRT